MYNVNSDAYCSDSAGLRQTTTTTKMKTTKKGNVTTCSFPLLDAAKFETRARRTDNAAVLVKGTGPIGVTVTGMPKKCHCKRLSLSDDFQYRPARLQ